MGQNKLSVAQVQEVVREAKNGANTEREIIVKTQRAFENLADKYGISINDVSIRSLYEAICDPTNDVDRTSCQQVSEAINSTAFPTIFNKLIFKQVWDGYTNETGDVFKLVTEINGDNCKKERIPAFVGYDAIDKVQESQKYPEDQTPERFAQINTHKIGKIVSLTLEFLMGDQTAVISKRAMDVGRQSGSGIARFITQKTFGLACSLTGEGATQNMVIDGVAGAMYANDHSAIDGQLCDNYSTTAFGTSGVTACRTLLRRMVDPRGNEITVTPTQLVVPPELWQQAAQLVRSVMQYDIANNAINPFANQFELIELPFLASTTQFYLGNHPQQTWLIWDWKPKLETQGNTSEQAFERDVVSRHKFSAQLGCGVLDYRFSTVGGAA